MGSINWKQRARARNKANKARQRNRALLQKTLQKCERTLLELADAARGPIIGDRGLNERVTLDERQLGWLADAARSIRRVRDAR